METSGKSTDPRRRNFLKGAALGGAAALANGAVSSPSAAETAKAASPQALAANNADAAADALAEVVTPREMPKLTAERVGSDYMVDVIKALGIEYIAANPGSSFRGIHESLINYGGNKAPELLTCMHESVAVSIATGYARASNKPMAAMLHSTVGMQHGAMAIYNAFVDRTPVFMLSANISDAAERRPWNDWMHAVQDGASLVRDFTKWDDQPGSLEHFGESAMRAYKLAYTAPMAPTLIVADATLQEKPIPTSAKYAIPKMSMDKPPVGDLNAIDELARMLASAEQPVILADRYARTHAGMGLLVTLAELLGAGVNDQGARFNFPTDHPLNHSNSFRSLITSADVVLALEPGNLYSAINDYQDQLERSSAPLTKPGAKVVTLGVDNLFIRANYQDFQRYVGADIGISGDAEATMPFLIEAVRKHMTPADTARAAARTAALTEIAQRRLQRDREAAALAWDASPITTARLCMEIWAQIKNEDWVLPVTTFSVDLWPQRLWKMNKPYQYCGSLGAGGSGARLSMAIGAALAHRPEGRIIVNIQNDGDFMYAPGALWTAAHHRIPLLTVMHNNRAYHQEVMHIQRMANRLERGVDRAHIGTTIDDPNVDFAKLAQGMGVWAMGPITDPKDLAPALRRAIAVVKSGQPALVDVVTQPR